MEECPCGSGKNYPDCCQPYIVGERNAPTAEILMRSRYTAYAKADVDYLYDTTHAEQRETFNRKDSESWARKSEWLSLEIIRTEAGEENDETGLVEFAAKYRSKNKSIRHHELAEFKKEEGKWYFVDGKPPEIVQVVRQGPKIGRNDPCPCGSGKKYKKCCGR